MSKGKRNREKNSVEKVKTYTFTADQIAKMREESRQAGYNAGWDAARDNLKKTVEDETAKIVDQLCFHYDVHVLYILHVCYGWGYKRLHDFYHKFSKEHERLKKKYEQHDIGNYVAVQTVRELGIDLDEWYKEVEGTDDG